VELTDSIYVAISMGIMTSMGKAAWQQLGESGDFTRCLHSVGELDPLLLTSSLVVISLGIHA
jgi:phosphoenolpyruvate carboxykinase (GTP)